MTTETRSSHANSVHSPRKIDDHARDAAVEWLMARINYERTAMIPYQERQLKLDRMRQLLTRLGQPDAGLKIVHVAGTKGKGSTSAMVAAMLSAAGYRCGVFSSPHLMRLEERFVIDGQPCTAEQLVEMVDRVRPAVRAMDDEARSDGDSAGGPTYFEITTAMAMLHFVEQQADAAVLEVGLGGRLDSTNVCLPAVSVITSISFDHMKQLGNTLGKIAREKAGIIKPGIPVVCGVLEAEPQAVISEVAREHGCRLIQLGRDFQFDYHAPISGNAETAAGMASESLSTIDFTYRVAGEEFSLADIPLAMRGPHQAMNAAVALATVCELRHQGWCISSEAMRSGLSRAVMPGRVEVISQDPLVVLDTAHNTASARALVNTLSEMSHVSRRTLVVSISYDKDIAAILTELAPHFDRFVVTEYQENPRAASSTVLAGMLQTALGGRQAEVIVCETPALAWQHVTQHSMAHEMICIAGSFFVAAELSRLIHGK